MIHRERGTPRFNFAAHLPLELVKLPNEALFCFQDIIFEVMPNSHIASITLYNQTPGSRHVNRVSGHGVGAGVGGRTNKNAFA